MNIIKNIKKYNKLYNKIKNIDIKNKFFMILNIKKYNKLYDKIKNINIKEKYKLSNIIILDIETTGLFNNDYIIQIAYNIYNKNLDCIAKKNFIINENVNKTDFYNLFSLSLIKKKGLDVNYVFNILKHDINNCKYIIGHNISFDIRFIDRYFKKLDIICDLSKSICTMNLSKNYLQLKNIKGSIKNPKLIELYNYFYTEEQNIGTLHDASCDIEITYLCFIKLIKHNLIKECKYDNNIILWY